jgi:hypothetical protein
VIDATAIAIENNVQNRTAVSSVVPFRSTKLLLVDYDGVPFVPMKPVVEGMGLTWQSQHVKLSSGRFKTCITEIVIQLPGDSQRRSVTCLPLRKLTGWLMSIHPGKVREALRDGIIAYQNECDDALWAYWSDGHAVNHRGAGQAMTVIGQTIGTDGFHMLGAVVKGKVSSLPVAVQRRATAKIWSQTHAAFGVRSAADIPADQLDAARNFIAAYSVHEGEFLPKGSGKGNGLPDQLSPTQRFLVFTDHAGHQQVQPISREACVMTHREMISGMITGDIMVSTPEMFEFLAAVTENLRLRSLNQARRAAA